MFEILMGYWTFYNESSVSSFTWMPPYWKLIGRCKKSKGIIFYFPLQVNKREEKEKEKKRKKLLVLEDFIWTISNFTYL